METIDAYSINSGSTLEADLCIIGGGAAGIGIAREFINTKYKVLLLESGDHEFDEKTQSIYDFESVGHPLRAQEGYVSRNRYLGGSTNTWAGRCAPMNDIDFEQRDWVPYSGWPITRADLEDYYQKASEVLKLPDYRYFLTRDWEQYVTQYRSDYLDDKILSPAVFLFAPQPINMRLAYGQQLQDSSNIQICVNANVIEIESHPGLKTIEKVHATSFNQNTFFVKAKFYVLACGGWENARLMLLSQRHTPNGLGNQHDTVGRYYMEHPKIDLGTITPQTAMLKSSIFLGRKDIQDGMIEVGVRLSDSVQRTEKLLNHYTAMSPIYDGGRISDAIASLFGKKEAYMPSSLSQSLEEIQYIFSHLVKIPNSLRKQFNLPLRFDKVAILSHFEHAPNPNSRVMLSNERDALGTQKLSVDLRVSSEEKRCIIRNHEILKQVLQEKGIGSLESEFPDVDSLWPGLTDSSHHMGTTRMSHNPKEGVVNQDCQVHGIHNLYIASGSVFFNRRTCKSDSDYYGDCAPRS
jgi:choline dehydrogenase-like flavoprotein